MTYESYRMGNGSLWKEVSYGDKVPDEFMAVIETPMGSRNKFEVNKDGPGIVLDRVLYSSVSYPANYGFIPRTYYDDGDPIDVLVISSYPLPPGTIVNSRPLGTMHMIDGGDKDDKILAVAVKDPHFFHVKTMKDLGSHLLSEIENFFTTYKLLENKKTSVNGWGDAEDAKKQIMESIENYNEKFSSNIQ